MRLYLQTHKKPVDLYNDKHSPFSVNRSGALGGDGLTQFQRAIKQLGIQMVHTHPKQKGAPREAIELSKIDTYLRDGHIEPPIGYMGFFYPFSLFF